MALILWSFIYFFNPLLLEEGEGGGVKDVTGVVFKPPLPLLSKGGDS